MTKDGYSITHLTAGDLPLMRQLLGVYGEAFEDKPTYVGAMPGDAYLERLLSNPWFITVVAMRGDAVVGGLSAYVLQKFEQERSEIYIYDLAVETSHRRKGLATALIEELRRIGTRVGAYVIFVQADPGDDPAMALYAKLGRREDVHHFDISVP